MRYVGREGLVDVAETVERETRSRVSKTNWDSTSRALFMPAIRHNKQRDALHQVTVLSPDSVLKVPAFQSSHGGSVD